MKISAISLILLGAAAFASHANAQTRTVCASGCSYTTSQLQQALNESNPGDTILLQRGFVFGGSQAPYVLRQKSCSAQNDSCYITIKTGVDASGNILNESAIFPPAQVRITPSYASSMAKFAKNAADPNMPIFRTVFPGEIGNGCLAAPCRSDYYRFQFLEFMAVSSAGGDLVTLGSNDTAGSVPAGDTQNTLVEVPQRFILDRCYLHGLSATGQKRGIGVHARYVWIINSYISEIWSDSQDSQDINYVNGPGDLVVTNNYLEGAAENFMAGGDTPRMNYTTNGITLSAATATSASLDTPLPDYVQVGDGVSILIGAVKKPTIIRSIDVSRTSIIFDSVGASPDVPGAVRGGVVPRNLTFSKNDVIKPVSWRGTSKGSNAKNLFELKNWNTATVEGNRMQYSWTAGQSGFAVLMTVINQDGGNDSAIVANITFRKNHVAHANGGLQMTGYSADNVFSQRSNAFTVEDNLWEDIDDVWGGGGAGLDVTTGTQPGCAMPSDVTFNHNTLDKTSGRGSVEIIEAAASCTGATNFRLTNNLIRHSGLGLVFYRIDPPEGFRPEGTTSWNEGTAGNSVASNNVFVDATATAYTFSSSSYFPSSAQFMASLVDYANGNFRVVQNCGTPSATCYDDAGSDGKDIGADIDAIDALTSIAIDGDDRGSQSGSPYGGTPAAIPGAIQAEAFDEGGAGIAYVDTTPGNYGEQYRDTDVDIEPTTDTGGGYSLGWAVAGEWLNYTVNVAAAGTYAIDVRVASNGQGGTFHVEIGGSDKTGPLTVPDTGAWQSWTTIRIVDVVLTPGAQLLKLVMDSNGPTTAVGNFNWIAVTRVSSPYGGTPIALPGIAQAENFDDGGEGLAYHDTSVGNYGEQYRATDVDIEPSTDTGGGYSIGWAVAGEWLNYTVNVTAPGIYDIAVRVASNGVGGTFHIEVNGVDKTGPLTVPNTGGWQTWSTINIPGVSLSAGKQMWRIVMDADGPNSAVGNFNWIGVSVH